MSKIVVCYYSENGESFYDAFCGKLKDMGNNVFQFNTKNYIKTTDWGGEFSLLPFGFDIISHIKSFNSNLMVAFSNAFPTEVIDVFSCPICLWDAYDPQFFWNKEYIKKHLDRFTFLGFKECSKVFKNSKFRRVQSIRHALGLFVSELPLISKLFGLNRIDKIYARLEAYRRKK